jgi:hypothetical protein
MYSRQAQESMRAYDNTPGRLADVPAVFVNMLLPIMREEVNCRGNLDQWNSRLASHERPPVLFDPYVPAYKRLVVLEMCSRSSLRHRKTDPRDERIGICCDGVRIAAGLFGDTCVTAAADGAYLPNATRRVAKQRRRDHLS